MTEKVSYQFRGSRVEYARFLQACLDHGFAIYIYFDGGTALIGPSFAKWYNDAPIENYGPINVILQFYQDDEALIMLMTSCLSKVL